MSLLYSLVARFATKRGFAILLAIYAVVFGAIIVTVGQIQEVSGGIGILDFEPGYSKERVAEVFSNYGDRGMALYRRVQVLDLFNPALYSLIASVLTYLLWRGRGPQWLCLMPMLGGIGDYAENLTLFLLSRSFPELPDTLVQLSSTLSLVKNGLIAIGLLPILVGVLLWALGKLR